MRNWKKLSCALIAIALVLAPMASAETASVIGGPPFGQAASAPVVAADTAAGQAPAASSVAAATPKPAPVPTSAPSPALAPKATPKPVPAIAPAATPKAQAAQAKVLDADGTLLLNDDPERYFVQVDETNQVVTAFEKDDFGRYTVVARQMICSTGKRSTPSPNGSYEMGDERIRFGFFVKHNCYGQYWSQITRNIYFHSVLYSERNTKSLIKSSFNDLGKAVSHGCVRLMPQDAKWIYQNIPEGTKVEFTHKIKKNAELTKSLKPEKYVD